MEPKVESGSSVSLDFPMHCEGCGRCDSSLRLVIFSYVISVIILTSRRSTQGLYCERCRRHKMLIAKLITLFFGLWGIPWGIIYSLEVLFGSDEGEIPSDANATYLKNLGAYYLGTGNLGEALYAFNASLKLRRDTTLEGAVRQVFGSQASDVRLQYKNRGITFSQIFFGAIVLLAIWVTFSILMSPSSIPASPSPIPASFTKLSLTSKQPSTAEPSPTVKVIKAETPSGWEQFVSEQARFSAYIPKEFIPEKYPPTAENPMIGVSFAADSQTMGPDATVITVSYFPFVDVDGSGISELELEGFIEEWVSQRKVDLVAPPVEISVGRYNGFELVHQAQATDKSYVVRAHSAFILTHAGLYYVEVAGFSNYNETLEKYYDTFMKWFQPDAL